VKIGCLLNEKAARGKIKKMKEYLTSKRKKSTPASFFGWFSSFRVVVYEIFVLVFLVGFLEMYK
jgi:hypothetical protein